MPKIIRKDKKLSKSNIFLQKTFIILLIITQFCLANNKAKFFSQVLIQKKKKKRNRIPKKCLVNKNIIFQL